MFLKSSDNFIRVLLVVFTHDDELLFRRVLRLVGSFCNIEVLSMKSSIKEIEQWL